MKVHYTTVATKDGGYLPVLKQGFVQHGLNLNILAWGEQWKGWVHKIEALSRFMQSECKEDELIVYIDGYDVLLLRSDCIVEKFLSYRTDILISYTNYEEMQFPSIARWYAKTMFTDSRLCAGAFMGRCKELCVMCHHILNNSVDANFDDQREMARVFRSEWGQRHMRLDYNRKIFLNYFRTSSKVFDTLDCTGSNFVHGAGNIDMNHISSKYFNQVVIQRPMLPILLKATRAVLLQMMPEMITLITLFILFLVVIFYKRSK